MDNVQVTPEEKTSAPKISKKTILIIAIAAVVVIAAVIDGILIFSGESKQDRYNVAIEALEEGQIDDAVDIYKEIGEYKDLLAQITTAAVETAEEHLDDGNYASFVRLVGYVKDYDSILGEISEVLNDETAKLMKKDKYYEALELFVRLKKYPALQTAVETQYAKEFSKQLENDNLDLYYYMTYEEADMAAVKDAIYSEAKKRIDKEEFEEAGDLLSLILDYKDAAQIKEDLFLSIYLQELKEYLENGNYYWAEVLINDYDGDKQPLIDEYLKYCADSTLLEDMAKALKDRLALEKENPYAYTDLVKIEMDVLDKYYNKPFYDDELEDLFWDYYYALDDQEYYANYFTNYNYYESYERAYYWAICDAERFETLEALYDKYGFAKNDQELLNIFVGTAEAVRNYAQAGYDLGNDIDWQIYWGSVNQGEDGLIYIRYINETEYTFNLTVYHYDETGLVVEEDIFVFEEIAPSQEIMIPVGVVTNDYWGSNWWELGWDISEISGGNLAG